MASNPAICVGISRTTKNLKPKWQKLYPKKISSKKNSIKLLKILQMLPFVIFFCQLKAILDLKVENFCQLKGYIGVLYLKVEITLWAI